MKAKVDISLENKDFDKLISRFHFNESSRESIVSFYSVIKPLLNPIAFYEIENEKINILMTLGDGIDELIELYEKNNCLEEAYIIDCIGSELLSKAYKAMIKKIEADTGKFVSSLQFLGDKYPLEMTKDFFEKLRPEGMSYNDAFILTPSKSVSMIMTLSEEKPACPVENECNACQNFTCPNRNERKKITNTVNLSSLPKTYGNSVIFNL